MNPMENYGSDEELQTTNSNFSQGSGDFKGAELDTNYDNITMDMSEESSHNEPSSPRSLSSDSRSSSSSCQDDSDRKSERKDYHRSDERSQYSPESPDYQKGSRELDKKRKNWRDEHHKDRDDKKSHRYSRSPSYHRYDRSRRSRSRSPRERGRYSRREHNSPNRRRRAHRDRSRGSGTGGGGGIGSSCDRRPSKLSILEKLGIELKLPETDKDGTPLSLPSYYNPVAMNPAKYAQQIAKRKLLWGNSQKQKASGDKEDNNESKTTTSVWQGARFSQDQDGKLSAKFQRLMGIKKDSNAGGDSSTSSQEHQDKDLLKQQEELFSSMELQYEVARQATHTQRGVGLGFGAHHFTK